MEASGNIMNRYVAPLGDIVTALRLVGLDDVLALAAFDDIGLDTVHAVLAGFGTLASEVIAPTNRIGDTVGAIFDPGAATVTTAPELTAAFAEYSRGGWTALSAPVEAGGGGFPGCIATAVREMFGSANMALSLNPVLTQSAIELLEQWGTDRQKALYLLPLVAGEWTGTMNLTESDAGSDLGAIRAMAIQRPDGRWSINGTKIFITWGEHELTENIVHFVLARTPQAPPGVRGISLFVVPKVNVGDDGRLQERNGVRVVGLEHKLGIHASPTCVLQFDDAVGELVGPLHNGMAAMFSMMNPARVAIGLQGVSIGERAMQQAASFAAQRRQGRVLSEHPAPIHRHPDVQRMLTDMAVSVKAARLLVFATSVAADMAAHHPDREMQSGFQARADLLTPLAKAWATDEGVRLASLAIQIHGGMGFVEETGVAQYYRDARIAPIYEGTNGIQAIDLVGRKVARDDGAAMSSLLDDVETIIGSAGDIVALAPTCVVLRASLANARQSTRWIVGTWKGDPSTVLAGAGAYLRLIASTVTAGYVLSDAVRAVCAADPSAGRLIAQSHFFAVEHVASAPSFASITIGSDLLSAALDLD